MSHLICTRTAGSQLIRRSSWRSSLALFLLLVCGAFATDAAAQENDGVAQSGSGSDYVTHTVGSARRTPLMPVENRGAMHALRTTAFACT